jgi:hypothetical protein
MEYRILGINYSEPEAERLILARSLEWEALPVFATRSVAPIALFWFSWWQICLCLVAAALVWCPFRTKYVNLALSMVLSFVNNIFVSVLINAAVAVMFFINGKTLLAIISLLWHLVSTLLAFTYPPSTKPIIQEKLWEQLEAA